MMMQQRREGGGGRGEVRRIHVVYFLSRNGRTDQPHLMRVHHRHSDGGVRLSDVKRWLSELRGKYMPDSYSWSYKRRYKTGYVWQDLTGDDLITPIDDNEYVLKGSLISPDEDNNRKPSKNQKPTVAGDPDRSPPSPPEKAEEVVNDDEDASPKPPPPPPHNDDDSPRPPPPAPPPPTTYVDASTQTPPTTATPRRATAVFKLDLRHQNQTSSCETETEPEGKKKKTTTTPASSSSSLGKSKSRSGGKGIAAYVFRNLITCGEMEAYDSAAITLPVNRRETPPPPPENHIHNRGSFGEKMAGEVGKKGTGCRLGEPYCSQCGKAFKPEKLHSHMKSCRALKGKERSTSRSEKTPRGPAEDGLSKDMISTFLLAH